MIYYIPGSELLLAALNKSDKAVRALVQAGGAPIWALAGNDSDSTASGQFSS